MIIHTSPSFPLSVLSASSLVRPARLLTDCLRQTSDVRYPFQTSAAVDVAVALMATSSNIADAGSQYTAPSGSFVGRRTLPSPQLPLFYGTDAATSGCNRARWRSGHRPSVICVRSPRPETSLVHGRPLTRRTDVF